MLLDAEGLDAVFSRIERLDASARGTVRHGFCCIVQSVKEFQF